jgi:formylglycine-generating enzyme required for sulfatase activity
MNNIRLSATLLFLTVNFAILAQKTTKIKVITDELLGEFVLVKGGEFVIGCTDDQGNCNNWNYFKNDSNSMHCKVNSFYIAKTEVTQRQWQSVMGSNPSYHNCPECPVENINNYDIEAFLEKLNKKSKRKYRLPTVFEWEYAARGGNMDKKSMFPGSDELNLVAWNIENSNKSTQPVAQKLPNELGLFDMAGNVNEICLKEKNHIADNFKSCKGGSYISNKYECKIGYLEPIYYYDVPPIENYFDFGIRLLMEVKK